MIPGVGGIIADLPQSHMFTTIDTQKKQFGIWVKNQAVPIQALPLITPQNKLDILIQLDHKVNIFLRMLLNDQTVKFLIHCQVSRVIRYQAEIGNSNGGPVIAKQFVVLKPFVSKGADLTGVDGLLEGVPDQEIVREINAFNAKDAFNAFKSNDTSLMEISYTYNDANPKVRAQVVLPLPLNSLLYK